VARHLRGGGGTYSTVSVEVYSSDDCDDYYDCYWWGEYDLYDQGDGDYGWSAHFGWRAHRYFAIEAGYVATGSIGWTRISSTCRSSTTSTTIACDSRQRSQPSPRSDPAVPRVLGDLPQAGRGLLGRPQRAAAGPVLRFRHRQPQRRGQRHEPPLRRGCRRHARRVLAPATRRPVIRHRPRGAERPRRHSLDSLLLEVQYRFGARRPVAQLRHRRPLRLESRDARHAFRTRRNHRDLRRRFGPTRSNSAGSRLSSSARARFSATSSSVRSLPKLRSGAMRNPWRRNRR